MKTSNRLLQVLALTISLCALGALGAGGGDGPPSAATPPSLTHVALSSTSVPAAGPSAAPQGPAARELPPLDSLKGLASEYKEFMRPGVDEHLRRAALKKLFSDPYFNAPDPFEAYSGDFTRGEPIPAAMLKTIVHAKGLLFGQEKVRQEG
jgi:hypothetical protein